MLIDLHPRTPRENITLQDVILYKCHRIPIPLPIGIHKLNIGV